MSQPIFSDDTSGVHLPASKPPAIVVIAVLYLVFGCGFPLYQLHEARRQAHQDLLRILTVEKQNAGAVVAAFDHANQNLDAAASGPCMILAFTGIFLVNQLLKLKRRYNALAQDSVPSRLHRDDAVD